MPTVMNRSAALTSMTVCRSLSLRTLAADTMDPLVDGDASDAKTNRVPGGVGRRATWRNLPADVSGLDGLVVPSLRVPSDRGISLSPSLKKVSSPFSTEKGQNRAQAGRGPGPNGPRDGCLLLT